MEEPDSGFHAVGVLTRSPAWEYGWKFNYLTENTSGAEKSEVKEKIPPKPLTALEHLERCGIESFSRSYRKNFRRLPLSGWHGKQAKLFATR